ASRDIIGKYSDKLCCTHLNDNMGQTTSSITWLDDSHLLPFDGVGNWDGIAARLKKANYTGDLTFELTVLNKPERNTHDIYAGLDFEAYSALALERAKKFKSMMQ
ncbi:MAG: sugar phosphate isomerase/epimerase, partial [Clostridia bacterium]|nr:sugar phosphate isomerase/epimerase [Clostridia bacterium]